MAGEFKLNGNRGTLTLVLFLLAQFGAGAWWASGVSHDMIYLKEQVRYIKTEVRCLQEQQVDWVKEILRRERHDNKGSGISL